MIWLYDGHQEVRMRFRNVRSSLDLYIQTKQRPNSISQPLAIVFSIRPVLNLLLG
jgi:hypothetical protein